MTGLFSRGFFYEYARRLIKNNPDLKTDAIVLNIEQFHLVNELNGRAYGDSVLKMDRGFIKNIEHSAQDFRLVELILDIAKNLKMPVIAEGVETENQLAMLKNAGCDFVQGYYFSRPVPPEEFEKFIAKNH